ncbi:LamG domain-containing protein [Parvularcula flava]|nr:hypothetical protein [Aquisalinus luteolus]NHK29528.1 LamG domain-containing protein [Aquisalinus luteolus]
MIKSTLHMGIIVSASLALAACGNGGNDAPSEPVSAEPETEIVQGDDMAGVNEDVAGVSFDGQSLMRYEMADMPNDFSVFMTLASASRGTTDFSTTTPQMPAVIGDIAVYQLDDSYSLRFGMSEERIYVDGATTSQDIQIDVAAGTGITVYRNGSVVRSLQLAEPIDLDGLVVLGKGFQSRFWRGSVSDFRIVGSDGETLVSLDQLESR